MRAGLEFWLLPKSQNVLEQIPAAEVNTGQSGFIYVSQIAMCLQGQATFPPTTFNSLYFFFPKLFSACFRQRRLLQDK